MTTLEEEMNILKRVKEEINKATDREKINQIYKSARNWNRIHHFYAKACTYEKYTFINRKLKSYRIYAISNMM